MISTRLAVTMTIPKCVLRLLTNNSHTQEIFFKIKNLEKITSIKSTAYECIRRTVVGETFLQDFLEISIKTLKYKKVNKILPNRASPCTTWNLPAFGCYK